MNEHLPRRPYLPLGGEAPPLPRWHAYVLGVFVVLVFVPSVLVPLAGLTGIGVPFEGTLVGPRWPSEGFEVRSTALPELAADTPSERLLYVHWYEGWLFRTGISLALAYACVRVWLVERSRRLRIEPLALLVSAGYLLTCCWASNRLEAHWYRTVHRGGPFDGILVRSGAGVVALGLFVTLAIVGCFAILRMARRRDSSGGFGIAATGVGLSLWSIFWLDFGVVGAPQLRKIPGSLDVDLPALEVGHLARWIPYGGSVMDSVYAQVTEGSGTPVLQLRHTRHGGGWEPPVYHGPADGSWSEALDGFASRAEAADSTHADHVALETWVQMDVDHDVPFETCRSLLRALAHRGFSGLSLLHAGPGCTEIRFSVGSRIRSDASAERPVLTLGNPPRQKLLTVGDRTYDTLQSLLSDPTRGVDASEPIDILVEDDVPWSHVVQLLGAFELPCLRFEMPE